MSDHVATVDNSGYAIHLRSPSPDIDHRWPVEICRIFVPVRPGTAPLRDRRFFHPIHSGMVWLDVDHGRTWSGIYG